MAERDIDLYHANFAHLPPEDLYRAVLAFTRIDQPLDSRPAEGFILDFKRDWGPGCLDEIAGFANTFGGLLIVGIRDLDGQPVEILGFPPKGEVKTRIVNMIVSNIVPTPQFQVATCRLPGDFDLHLAVVRVQPSHILHLLTRGDKPAYVRLEDSSKPADALRLRFLIDRERQIQNQSIEGRLSQWKDFYVRKTYRAGPAASDTQFKIVMMPRSNVSLRLGYATEREFTEELLKHFRLEGIAGQFSRTLSRDLMWYQFGLKHEVFDYELLWRITSAGEVGFVAQARWPNFKAVDDPNWSLFDVVAHTVFALRLAHTMWTAIDYYGEVIASAYLNVAGLKLLDEQGFPPLFYSLPQIMIFPLSRSLLAIDPNGRTASVAERTFDYAMLDAGIGWAATELLSDLFRGLGHLVVDDQQFHDGASNLF